MPSFVKTAFALIASAVLLLAARMHVPSEISVALAAIWAATLIGHSIETGLTEGAKIRGSTGIAPLPPAKADEEPPAAPAPDPPPPVQPMPSMIQPLAMPLTTWTTTTVVPKPKRKRK